MKRLKLCPRHFALWITCIGGIMKGRISLVAIMTVLSACAGTHYQKLGVGGGYSDKQMEPGRWEVRFLSNVASTEGFAEKAAIYRTAELAQANGYPYFQVVSGSVRFNTHAIATSTSIGYMTSKGQTAKLVAVGKREKNSELNCEGPDRSACANFDTAQVLNELRPIMKQAGHRRPVKD
ncbi:CC0125/CC1285 family lipoprotein [Sphingopyxis solisilvae]|uniref:CC0125/CC1285 family lipoprotein n=1 Tax=Sphingopyxis solisilvae TaxID=1886788 RepID=UPI001892B925|nr:hypothetical protein [Sphingopyxis solisilvae]